MRKMKSPPSGVALPIDARALAVLLTLLVLLAALLLATLLLAWLLLAAALLLTALLLLAGFLVRILIHGSFLFKYWFEAPFRSLTSHGKSQTAEVAFVPTTPIHMEAICPGTLSVRAEFPSCNEESRRWDAICFCGCLECRFQFFY